MGGSGFGVLSKSYNFPLNPVPRSEHLGNCTRVFRAPLRTNCSANAVNEARSVTSY